MISKFRTFLTDKSAAAGVEYILLLLPLIAMVFTAFQIALAYHFSLTAQKAVELGARIAVVRDAVHTGLPQVNEAASGFGEGDSCAVGACETPAGGPWVCNGADLGSSSCDAVAYSEIFDEVGRIAYLLDAEDMTVTYFYGGLGFAGGPFTPIVEVSIDERPFFLQFFFNLAFASADSEVSDLNLPAVAASAIAEDLSSAN